jgi:cell wall-associated NlpC family hydrolase
MLRLRLTLVLCLLAVAGPAANATAAAPQRHTRADVGVRVARYARTLVGVPYRYGGMSPRSGFDCSGLVTFVYRHFGIALPHYTGGQISAGRRVRRRRLRAGDLLFFGLGHVGLYVGRGMFVHAPHTGARVRIESLWHGWYGGRLTAARRVA